MEVNIDISNDAVCYGCLCTDRNIQLIDEFERKNCFLQIIGELPVMKREDPSVWLCWECDALLRRFSKFKRKVKHSFEALHGYAKLIIDSTQLKPTFSVNQLFNISYPQVECDSNEIKQEIIPNIKQENDSDNSNHSDNFFLINLKQNSKKKKIKKVKKEKEIYKKKVLNQEEIERERRLMREEDGYMNAEFKCERCIVSFSNEDDLKDHVTTKHVLNGAKHKCSICECAFPTDVTFSYHTKKHNVRYKCCYCKVLFKSKRAVTKHYEIMHSERNNSNGLTTQNGSKPEKSFPCEFCDKVFIWSTSLRKHLEVHRIETGQKRRPYCETCCLSFTTTSNLQKHVKTSSKHKIQLKLRKLSPQEESSIAQIRNTINSSRELFPCPQCDKKFQWRGNLQRHLLSHAARLKGELVCTPCNRTFSSIATYTQHMRISRRHVSEDDFKFMCSDCGKKFASKTHLSDHINWEHLKNFIHTCTICQKVFKTHTSLYLHRQVVHRKNTSEHLCDHCGKPFPNRSKLRSHILALHSDTCAYKCTVCGARFSWHSCLSRHVRRVHARSDT